jgi:hypothetical protein
MRNRRTTMATMDTTSSSSMIKVSVDKNISMMILTQQKSQSSVFKVITNIHSDDTPNRIDGQEIISFTTGEPLLDYFFPNLWLE